MKKLHHSLLAATAAFLSFTASSQAAVLAYWQFETNSGNATTNGQTITSADDSSGNGYTLSNLSTPTTPSAFQTNTGQFFSPVPQTGATNSFFASINENGLTTAANGILNGVGTYTIELSFRRTGATGGAQRVLFDSRATSGANGFSIELSDGTPDNLRFSRPGFGTSVTTGLGLALNTTYSLAMVKTGSTAQIYLGSTLVSTLTGFDAGTSLAGQAISIGSYKDNTNLLPGFIDQVRISDTALTTSQFLSVPEPSTAAMLVAFGGLFFLRRKFARSGGMRSA